MRCARERISAGLIALLLALPAHAAETSGTPVPKAKPEPSATAGNAETSAKKEKDEPPDSSAGDSKTGKEDAGPPVPDGDEAVPTPEKRPTPPPLPPGKSTAPSEGKPLPGDRGASDEPEKDDADTENSGTDEDALPEPRSAGVHEDPKLLAACYHQLNELGVAYQKQPAVNDEGRCGMEAPISVSEIQPGISLKPENEMRCQTALALARWTKRVVEPAAEELGDGVELNGLSHGSAYVCRHRNHIPDAKISQHAFGDAVDIVTFNFTNHPPLSIEPRHRTGKIEEGFQRAVIAGACLYFTTVLGPQADAAHQDNLHMDVIERHGGFRLCQ
ncbi:extensin-like domain-containing protein [Pararhizobium mangrovi]|nr:extensin family protein [Pararhizobium mangrovi]